MSRAYDAATGELAWQADEATADFASPLVDDGIVYLTNKVGVVFALDAAHGAQLWTARLPGACWASALAARGRLYFFGVDGKTTVLRATRRGAEPVRENALAIEGRVYGVAAAECSLLIRTGRQLFRIGPPLSGEGCARRRDDSGPDRRHRGVCRLRSMADPCALWIPRWHPPPQPARPRSRPGGG